MAIAQDLNTLKTKEQGLTQNKVSRFAYTQNAYDNDTVAGVSDYVPSRDMNVPLGTTEIMKVNPTIPDKGWRAQASALTRMLMNHFLGRISYNLNKAHDNFLSFLTSLQGSLGTANGIATLDENGRIPYSQLPESAIEYKGTWSADTNTPTLADGTGTLGDMYIVSVAGTQNLGSGAISFEVGDRVLYDGSVWQKLSSGGGGGTVLSVNNIQPDPVTKNVEVKADNIDTNSLSVLDLTNGMSWTLGTGSNLSGMFRDVHFANNIWVACSSAGIYWSIDGKTWTRGMSGNFYSVNFANGIWVAGATSYVYWSTDGKNWTRGTAKTGQTIPRSGHYTYIYYANNIWVACHADSPLGQGIITSSDGKVWQPPVFHNAADSINSIYYSEELSAWIACGDKFLYYTDNPSVELNGVSSVQPSLNIYEFQSVCYANGIWVAVGSAGVFTSEDNKIWTQVTGLVVGDYKQIYYNAGVWIVVSLQGSYYSTDGKSWQILKLESYNLSATRVCKANDLWVTVGYTIAYSLDAKNWISANLLSGYGNGLSLFYGNGIWVSGDNSGHLAWSVVPTTKNVEKILAYLLSKVG